MNYAFSNLLGTAYKGGSIAFTPDGNSLLSPVGNRVTCFDLINNKSFTFPFENNRNITQLAVSPNGNLLLTVDEDGSALMSHFHRRCILYRVKFKSRVSAIRFSPCGRFLAVALEHKNLLQLWRTPSYSSVREFAPLRLHRTYTGHFDRITSIQWTRDSEWIMTSSKDMTVRLYTREPVDGYTPITLSGHRDTVIGAWWSKDGRRIFSVSRDSGCFTWELQEPSASEESPFPFEFGHSKVRLLERQYFQQQTDHGPAKVRSAQFHQESRLLVVGFSHGAFGLWEMPDFNNIHTLSISQKKLDSVVISPSGEWLAFASAKLGQLLVWEWQSESYILKQQGHFFDMNTIAYSPDGQYIATGGDDGKVKLWNTTTGFCFVTFTEHAGAVTAMEFAGKQGGKQGVVFTASMDGTVRAFDMIRYRNFRTFTTPNPVQFSCLAVDPTGDIVCAGSMDSFEIYVWSVQTGRLLDVLAGHEGPISSLAFSPEGAVNASMDSSSQSSVLLASASWDQTVRVWDLFSRGISNKCTETFRHKSDVLSVAFRPDGQELCASTLDGTLSFWNPYDGESSARVAEINGRKDIAGGRKSTDMRTAQNTSADKHFTSLCYSADGNSILAGGNSKWICLYDIPSQVLLKKFQLSKNQSLDGMKEKLNSKHLTEAGPLDLINAEDDEPSDLEERLERQEVLPGVKKGDLSSRVVKPEIRSKCVRFSPTGRSWAAATTEGLAVYSTDDSLLFDPYDLDMDVTPESVVALVEKSKRCCRQQSAAVDGQDEAQWLQALIMAMRLNEPGIIQYVYESIPVVEMELVVHGLPRVYLDKLLRVIAVLLDVSQGEKEKEKSDKNATDGKLVSSAFRKSPHVQFHLHFLTLVLRVHGRFLRDHFPTANAASMNLRANQTREQQHALFGASSLPVIFRAIKKNVSLLREDLMKVCDENMYLMEYMLGSKDMEQNADGSAATMDVDDAEGGDAMQEHTIMEGNLEDLMLIR